MDIPDEIREHLEDGHCGNPACHGCNYLAMLRDFKAQELPLEDVIKALLLGLGQVYESDIELMPLEEGTVH